jgi:hypothetical protein
MLKGTDHKAVKFAVFPLTICIVTLGLKYLPQRSIHKDVWLKNAFLDVKDKISYQYKIRSKIVMTIFYKSL